MSKILGDNPFADDRTTDAAQPAAQDGAARDSSHGSERAETVPDALPPTVDEDDIFLGGEAAVPPRDYGPPIPSNLPDSKSVTSEIRELERRVRARLTPAFPIETKRRLPLEFLWKRYREFAMHDRSDVIDEYGRDPVYASRIETIIDFL